MKTLTLLTLALGLALPAGARNINIRMHRSGEDRSIVSIGKNVVVKPGQSVDDVVVIGASAQVLGAVEGSLVVIGGHADVQGSVEEDMVAIGSAGLGPKALIEGDAVTIGGALEADPAAMVRGDRVALSLPGGLRLEPLGQWLGKGLLWGRLLPHQYPWAWATALLLLLANILIALVFAKPVSLCEDQIEARPASTLLAGALGMALLGPLTMMLAISVIGLIAVPFLLCAALASACLGQIAVCRHIGRKLGLSQSLACVAAGSLILLLLYAVPILGLAAWSVATALGFGAAIMALILALRRESGETAASDPPAPATREVSADAALPRAGFWLRAAATILDAFLFAVIGGMTGVAFLGWLGWALYQVSFWCWKGTTVGGIVVGIQGLRVDGRPMDFSVALVRHLASYFSAAVFFLGFLWAGWDPEKQSWHDKIAGTLVVRVPRGRSLI